MKYLFFDIECSNCFNSIGKMCEFGYVLTDENLNLIKKDDIPMSPGKGRDNRFYLKDRKNEKDLELAYEYDYYFSQPEFPYYYRQIKKLMEDPETICLAYSMNNDIPRLYNACTRYRLEPLDYVCYDVQKLVSAYLEKKGQMSLHNACKEIVGPNSIVRLHEHLSRDDAEMARLIFKAICTSTNKETHELLMESSFAKTNSIEYMNKLKERGKSKLELKTSRTHYFSMVALDEELNNPDNKGRRYNVSDKLKKDKNKMSLVIERVKSKNGLFSGRINQTDIFITVDEKNKQEILDNLRHPFEGEFVTFDEFINK